MTWWWDITSYRVHTSHSTEVTNDYGLQLCPSQSHRQNVWARLYSDTNLGAVGDSVTDPRPLPMKTTCFFNHLPPSGFLGVCPRPLGGQGNPHRVTSRAHDHGNYYLPAVLPCPVHLCRGTHSTLGNLQTGQGSRRTGLPSVGLPLQMCGAHLSMSVAP